MPRTMVVLYQTENGEVPLLEWLDGLAEKARDKCRVRIERRMLYFFHGRGVVVVSHGIIKQGAGVPLREIDLAVQRKEAFEQNPAVQTYGE